MTQTTTSGVEALIDLVQRVRAYVKEPRAHGLLFADQPRYFRACSAMDMIEDTAQALRSYLAVTRKASDLGTSYLLAFGALQVLYVQQDAAFWLCECLGFPRQVACLSGPEKWIHGPGNRRLSMVRSLRNSSIGHPVWRKLGPESERGSYFIVQMSLGSTGFELQGANSAGAENRTNVDIPQLIRHQLEELEAVLERALDEISEAERAHRARFRGQRLETTFAGLSHPLEKMHQAVRQRPLRPLGMYGVSNVQRAMQTFREKLAERQEPFREDLARIYQQLDIVLARLTSFYGGQDDDSLLADILATFVGDRIAELREWARFMDEDYKLSATTLQVSEASSDVAEAPRSDKGESPAVDQQVATKVIDDERTEH